MSSGAVYYREGGPSLPQIYMNWILCVDTGRRSRPVAMFLSHGISIACVRWAIQNSSATGEWLLHQIQHQAIQQWDKAFQWLSKPIRRSCRTYISTTLLHACGRMLRTPTRRKDGTHTALPYFHPRRPSHPQMLHSLRYTTIPHLHRHQTKARSV